MLPRRLLSAVSKAPPLLSLLPTLQLCTPLSLSLPFVFAVARGVAACPIRPSLLAAVHGDGVLRLWDTAAPGDGVLCPALQVPLTHRPLTSMAWSHDGGRLVAACDTGELVELLVEGANGGGQVRAAPTDARPFYPPGSRAEPRACILEVRAVLLPPRPPSAPPVSAPDMLITASADGSVQLVPWQGRTTRSTYFASINTAAMKKHAAKVSVAQEAWAERWVAPGSATEGWAALGRWGRRDMGRVSALLCPGALPAGKLLGTTSEAMLPGAASLRCRVVVLPQQAAEGGGGGGSGSGGGSSSRGEGGGGEQTESADPPTPPLPLLAAVSGGADGSLRLTWMGDLSTLCEEDAYEHAARTAVAAVRSLAPRGGPLRGGKRR